MRSAILAVIMFAAATMAYSEAEYRNMFVAWMQKHQKAYSVADFQTRYTIFKSNADFVASWDAEANGFEVEINHLADLSNEEYQRIYLGTKIDGTARLEAARNQILPAITQDINATVDWRTKNIVTPVKNQGQCGSCWSFSTTGSTEGAHAQKTGNLVSLSEQNLVDCSTAEGNQGCDGGLMDQAFTYIIKNNGIDTEASYPYTAADGTCHFSASNVGATISSFKDVPSGNEAALTAAAALQPVSVAIDASHLSFQFYKSGVYTSMFCSTTKLDHGVLVVGYGVEGVKPYYIVKNSWGATWGMEGYLLMARNHDNSCGIATSASYPIV